MVRPLFFKKVRRVPHYFSTVKRLMTALRNSMGQVRLDSLLVIQVLSELS